MLLKDLDERDESMCSQMAELLEKEFPIFKELSRETPDEDKVVKHLCKDHLTMVRTFQ